MMNFLNKPLFCVTIKPQYLFTFFLCVATYFCTKSIEQKKAALIESRLKEVCFKYNNTCDDNLGNCTCEAKANEYDVMYILNK